MVLLAGMGMVMIVGASVGRVVAPAPAPLVGRLIGEFGGTLPAEEEEAPQPPGAVMVVDWLTTGELRRVKTRRTAERAMLL